MIKNLEKAEEKIEYLEGYNNFLKKHIKHTFNETVPHYKHKKKVTDQSNPDKPD